MEKIKTEMKQIRFRSISRMPAWTKWHKWDPVLGRAGVGEQQQMHFAFDYFVEGHCCHQRRIRVV